MFHHGELSDALFQNKPPGSGRGEPGESLLLPALLYGGENAQGRAREDHSELMTALVEKGVGPGGLYSVCAVSAVSECALRAIGTAELPPPGLSTAQPQKLASLGTRLRMASPQPGPHASCSRRHHSPKLA